LLPNEITRGAGWRRERFGRNRRPRHRERL